MTWLLPHLERAALLACVGVAAEVAFTALVDRRAPRLPGYSYLWMFPAYAVAYPALILLGPAAGALPWPVRGALYGVLLMLGELLCGLALKAALGEAPWEREYRGKKRTVLGLVRLDYFPAWALGGLVFERAFRLVTRA